MVVNIPPYATRRPHRYLDFVNPSVLDFAKSKLEANPARLERGLQRPCYFEINQRIVEQSLTLKYTLPRRSETWVYPRLHSWVTEKIGLICEGLISTIKGDAPSTAGGEPPHYARLETLVIVASRFDLGVEDSKEFGAILTEFLDNEGKTRTATTIRLANSEPRRRAVQRLTGIDIGEFLLARFRNVEPSSLTDLDDVASLFAIGVVSDSDKPDLVGGYDDYLDRYYSDVSDVWDRDEIESDLYILEQYGDIIDDVAQYTSALEARLEELGSDEPDEEYVPGEHREQPGAQPEDRERSHRRYFACLSHCSGTSKPSIGLALPPNAGGWCSGFRGRGCVLAFLKEHASASTALAVAGAGV